MSVKREGICGRVKMDGSGRLGNMGDKGKGEDGKGDGG